MAEQLSVEEIKKVRSLLKAQGNWNGGKDDDWEHTVIDRLFEKIAENDEEIARLKICDATFAKRRLHDQNEAYKKAADLLEKYGFMAASKMVSDLIQKEGE